MSVIPGMPGLAAYLEGCRVAVQVAAKTASNYLHFGLKKAAKIAGLAISTGHMSWPMDKADYPEFPRVGCSPTSSCLAINTFFIFLYYSFLFLLQRA